MSKGVLGKEGKQIQRLGSDNLKEPIAANGHKSSRRKAREIFNL